MVDEGAGELVARLIVEDRGGGARGPSACVLELRARGPELVIAGALGARGALGLPPAFCALAAPKYRGGEAGPADAGATVRLAADWLEAGGRCRVRFVERGPADYAGARLAHAGLEAELAAEANKREAERAACAAAGAWFDLAPGAGRVIQVAEGRGPIEPIAYPHGEPTDPAACLGGEPGAAHAGPQAAGPAPAGGEGPGATGIGLLQRMLPGAPRPAAAPPPLPLPPGRGAAFCCGWLDWQDGLPRDRADRLAPDAREGWLEGWEARRRAAWDGRCGPCEPPAAPGRAPAATEPGAKLRWAPAPAGRPYAFSWGWYARQDGLPGCTAETVIAERHWRAWREGWEARGELAAREAVWHEAPAPGGGAEG